MIGIDLKGKERCYKPQTAIVGVGFKSIILDFEDVKPNNREWLALQVFPRLCPNNDGEKISDKAEVSR